METLNRINGKKLVFGDPDQIAWIKRQEEKDKKCKICDGNGWTTCDYCGGEGEVTCKSCS